LLAVYLKCLSKGEHENVGSTEKLYVLILLLLNREYTLVA